MAMLLSPDRTLPVVVLTRPPAAPASPVNAMKLARRVQGLAHVCCLPPPATLLLTEQLGRRLSVFDGAVRAYHPGFFAEADPLKHPLVRAARVNEWVGKDTTGPTAFTQFLVEQLHAFSVSTPEKLDSLPSYFAIRRALLDQPNRTVEAEITLLRLELEEARARESEWRALAQDRDTDALAQETEALRLRAQNKVLAEDLRALRAARNEVEVPLPEDYASLQGWIDSYYADKLHLHPRAERALKNAVFKDTALVYQSLKLLGGAYWELCADSDPEGRGERVAAWEAGLRALRLDFNSHSIAENRLGEFREQYTIDYRIGQKPKQVLGPHLKYGSTKDDRFCMRVYFLWDDERQLVVIGHLPSHLETRAT